MILYNMRQGRRQFVKIGATIGTVGLAGCLGGDDDDSDHEWPPARGIVNTLTPAGPGDKRDSLPRHWMNVAQDYYPDDIETTLTSREGAGGLVALNATYNATPDGGTLGSMRAIDACVMGITEEEAEFDIEEFNFVVQHGADTRAIQINHNSIDEIDRHWQWTWDDLIEYSNENGLRFGAATGAMRLIAGLIQEWEPALDDDAWEIVTMPGGSETRAAMLAEDLDGYFGGFNSNISTRTEYYKTQIAIADPEADPDFVDNLKTLEPEDDPNATLPDEHIITNTSFPEQEAKDLAAIMQDGIVSALPPGVPDDIYDIHLETLEQVGEDEQTLELVAEEFSEQEHNPSYGQDVQNYVENKYELLNEEVHDIVMDVFG